jgi:hypothetical protein
LQDNKILGDYIREQLLRDKAIQQTREAARLE